MFISDMNPFFIVYIVFYYYLLMRGNAITSFMV